MSSGIEQPALRRATDVARTSVFEVRGSSINSDFRTRGQTLFWRFAVFPTEEPRTPTTGVRATPQLRVSGSKGKMAILNPQASKADGASDNEFDVRNAFWRKTNRCYSSFGKYVLGRRWGLDSQGCEGVKK